MVQSNKVACACSLSRLAEDGKRKFCPREAMPGYELCEVCQASLICRTNFQYRRALLSSDRVSFDWYADPNEPS